VRIGVVGRVSENHFHNSWRSKFSN
jgi:hypothetical protein